MIARVCVEPENTIVRFHYDKFQLCWKVKLLESMKTMDEDAFKAYFGDELMWTATLSNGSVVHLKPGHDDSNSQHIQFADRLHYISLVKQTRMNESRQQVPLNTLGSCVNAMGYAGFPQSFPENI